MPLWIWPVVALFLGYLLGSIPFGVVLTRAFGAGDIRQIGSGNIGATNVLRTGRKGLAAATLILDALKAVAAVLIARAMTSSSGSELELIAAAGAFFGHLYPVWLKFKGGKGVATLLGLCLILDWRVGLIFALVWLGGWRLPGFLQLAGWLPQYQLQSQLMLLEAHIFRSFSWFWRLPCCGSMKPISGGFSLAQSRVSDRNPHDWGRAGSAG